MDVFDKLKKRGIEARLDEPMSAHTSFKIGGPAACFVLPKDADELKYALRLAKESGMGVRIIGRGTNLLVNDKGTRDMVISTEKLNAVIINDCDVIAFAGAGLTSLAAEAAKKGLSGLEFAYGIPGSVGGAVVMNAGAFDGEMKDVLTNVSVITKDGEYKWLEKSELELGYRTSNIEENGYIVISAGLKLKKKPADEVMADMEKNMAARKEKQPLEYPSAGSTFKRPEGHFAGKLIMDAGLRGANVGGAKVSEKHCGFVVNAGNATFGDVRELISQIKEKVKKNCGVELECEIRIWDS